MLNNYKNEDLKPKPFLKWAGGKTQLLTQFQSLYPQILTNGECCYYLEPFLGSGAVFFSLYNQYSLTCAYLFDINWDIVIAYNVIKKSVDLLIEQLSDLAKKYHNFNTEQQKVFFYKIRDKFNLLKQEINYDTYSSIWVENTALLIFLNKTCFNGLYRTNKKGGFNVPHGKYKNPKILDENNLYAVAKALQIAEIKWGDFQTILPSVKNNCFIYFDPPYRPLNKTSSFNAYSPFEFNDLEQKRLADFYKYLHQNYDLKMMLSNSDPHNENPDDDFFDRIYQDFYIHKVVANRMINSKGNKRGNIQELVITNYLP